jgi:type II secretory pathway component PulJ
MRNSSRERGTTLVEALVYTALFGIVLTCIYWVLVASMRYYRIADSSVELQQNGMSAMTAVTQDLSESMSATVYDLDAAPPKGIIFASPRNRTSTGDIGNSYIYDNQKRLLWSKWICYYIAQNKTGEYTCLYKKEYWKCAANTGEFEPAASSSYRTTTAFKDDPSLKPRTVAKYVKDIQFIQTGNLIDLTLDLEKSPNPSTPNTLRLMSQIRIRNK